MWGIVLTNAAGEPVDVLTIEAPFESMREWCKRALESRPEASFARLISPDDLFEYVYPEGLSGGA